MSRKTEQISCMSAGHSQVRTAGEEGVLLLCSASYGEYAWRGQIWLKDVKLAFTSLISDEEDIL